MHAWIRRDEQDGLAGLMDSSRRPESCPHQVSAEVETAVCELRREHPRWGPLRSSQPTRAAVVQFQVGEWRLHSVLGARSMADYE